jgi:phage gpG-like protein
MPEALTIELTPKTIEMHNRLRNPDVLLRALLAALDYQNELSIGYIQSRKLSSKGPETLGVVTGRLRRSMSRVKAIMGAGGVLSGIGSNVSYAGAHEFGFNGTVQVRPFMRKNARNDLFKLGSGVAKREFAVKALSQRQLKVARVASGMSPVRAHTRKMKIPARHYIQKSIEARIPDYGAEIEKRMAKAITGGAA